MPPVTSDGEADVWSSFRLDPREPGNAGLRASDADRAVVQQVLTEAYADGRLDREELDARATTAGAARTLGELPPLLADLVAPPSASPARLERVTRDELERRAVAKYESDRREAFLEFVGPSLVCTAIWFLIGGGGFFWPGFVIVFTFLNVLRVVVNRRDMVENNRRKQLLQEEKEARRLETRDQPDGRDEPVEPGEPGEPDEPDRRED
jgi:hypothetical protein